jgi:low affinity Fe/Cu permease
VAAPHSKLARSRVMIRHLIRAVRHVSTAIADAAGRPTAQLLVLIGCGAWLLDGGNLDLLASGISVGAFILTQMVLNQQRKREMALQAKLDELILAIGARGDIVGLEHRTEEEIVDLRAEHHGVGGELPSIAAG